MATEYLKYEGGKFSKSRGTGVFGNDARDTGIPADYWRFYLLFVRPESQDSSFSWDDLALRINTELLNNLGNFVNRALMLVEKTYNSTIPEIRLRKDDITLLAFVNRELSLYIKMLESAKLRDALRHILAISRHGNQYIQSQQPWVKAKGTPDDKVDAGTVVGLAANIACLLSVLLQPYMPHTSQVMQEQMRSPENVNLITDQSVLLLPPGHKIGKPSPLFTKIETNSINEWKEKYGTKQSPPAESPNSEGVKKAQVTGTSKTVSRLQDAVDKQALLVRELKASGKPKSEWQPHVNTLLQLKADLAAAQLAVPAQSSPSEIAAKSETAGSAASEVEKLEEAIGKQANLVREMKTGGRSKEEYQPEVNKLLDLKKQLASLQPAATPGSTGQNKSTESSGSGKNKSKKKK